MRGTGKRGGAPRSHTRLHLPAPKASPGEIQHHGECQHHRGFSTTDRPSAAEIQHPGEVQLHPPCWSQPLTCQPHTHTADIPGPLWTSPGHREPRSPRALVTPTTPQTHLEHSRPHELPMRLPSPVRPIETPLTHQSVRQHHLFHGAPFSGLSGALAMLHSLLPSRAVCSPRK